MRAFLNRDAIRKLLFELDLSHKEFAAELGIGKAYWSQIFNLHRPLSHRVRRKLRNNRFVQGERLTDGQLWTVVTDESSSEPAAA